MTKYLFFILITISAICSLQGQGNQDLSQSNSNQAVSDSSTIVSNTFFDIFTGNPGKAAFYGLIIPGGGQAYNRKWWKLPIALGVEGGLIYLIVTNTQEYNGYQDAYLRNLKGEVFPYRGTSDVSILRSRRDSARKSREYAWVGFIIGHIVVLLEAFIDRHLTEFDVSDDLTFKPIITDFGQYNGLTYTIPLNKKKKYKFKNLLD